MATRLERLDGCRNGRGRGAAWIAALALWVMVSVLPMPVARAAESATGFYLLGTKTAMAGVTPPPGTYLQDNKLRYSGTISGPIVQSGVLTAGLDAEVYYELPTVLWVAERKILGGNVGFGATVPIGWKNVTAEVELDLPPPFGIELRREFQDDELRFGDPVMTALIGWRSGDWHWNLQTLVNVPVGFWERGNIANMGFNRWGIDTTAGLTWLDPKLRLELSAAAGFTFNFENPDTDYKTGTEFHVEWAAVMSLSKQLSIGVNGYHYEQVTGDSGSGARLGSFKGRVTGIGPILNYTFSVGDVPISTSLRYFKELNVQRRLEGDAGFLSVTVPLSFLSR